MKAPFEISLIRHRNLSSTFSNMPLARSEPTSSDDWIKDVFERSVPMSTYLVAYVISDFKAIAALTPKHGVRVEVAARPQAIERGHAAFALVEAASVIDFYIDYFDVAYPLKKSSNANNNTDTITTATSQISVFLMKDSFFSR